MTKAEVRTVPVGVYRVYWTTGGSSLAMLGVLPNGDRWLAPANWVHPTENQHVWGEVERLVLVLAAP
jgi:ABC-type cobalamin transport system permease subunit